MKLQTKCPSEELVRLTEPLFRDLPVLYLQSTLALLLIVSFDLFPSLAHYFQLPISGALLFFCNDDPSKIHLDRSPPRSSELVSAVWCLWLLYFLRYSVRSLLWEEWQKYVLACSWQAAYWSVVVRKKCEYHCDRGLKQKILVPKKRIWNIRTFGQRLTLVLQPWKWLILSKKRCFYVTPI
jgi:hypothetical protein